MFQPADPLQLLQEQPACDPAEAAQLARLTAAAATAAPLPGLRDFAPIVRQLFPEPAYLVGCGSSHIWLHRAAERPLWGNTASPSSANY